MSERSDCIIALLSENGALSATELSERLSVSVQTIRADLRSLDDAALIRRRNGMVQLRQKSENIAYHPRSRISRQEKQRIALAVKNLIPDGARVALGTGTTVEHCASFLTSHKGLFVVSNNIHAVCALQNSSTIEVEIAGGSVRMRDLDMIGAAAFEFYAKYRIDYAIFSCGGVSSSGMVMDYNSDEVSARKAISSCAKTKVLVVDKKKVGLDLACQYGYLWEYDIVVTTAELDEDITKGCVRNACRIIYV